MGKKNGFWIILLIFVAVIGYLIYTNFSPFVNGLGGAPSLESATRFVQQKKFAEAVTVYNSLIQKGEDLQQVYYGRASAYVGLRRINEAINDYTTSLSYGETAQTLASRCNAYRMYMELEKAVQDCRVAASLDPASADVQVALAFILLEKGDYDEAESVVTSLINGFPDNAMGYFVLARLQMAKGPSEKALDSLSKAIELDPKQPQFYWERGFMYYSNGMPAEAKADMEKLLKIADPNADGELMLQAGTLLRMVTGSQGE